MPDTQTPAPAFLHSAVIIDSDEVVQQLLAPAVRRALAACDGVILALSPQTDELLSAELGDAAARLQRADGGVYRLRLGLAYESFRRMLAAAYAAGRRLHVFAEPQVAREAEGSGQVEADGRTAAYLAYESMCNETFAHYGCEATCVWDARRHASWIIEDVRRLHRHELRPGGPEPSAAFVPPEQYLAGRNQLPLRLPGRPDWDVTLASLHGLGSLRAQLREWAGRSGFAPDAVRDVLLAVGEIAVNGVVHGRPPVLVHGWRDGETLVVQVDDHGGIPLPATAGYVPPGDEDDGHRGLWVARQLADILQTHTAGDTTSVRLFFPREVSHRAGADGPP